MSSPFVPLVTLLHFTAVYTCSNEGQIGWSRVCVYFYVRAGGKYKLGHT